MSILQAISIAESGLSAAERRLATASDDIANAQTPGHTNKTAVTTAGFGVAGVRVATIERAGDPFIQAERRDADAEAAAAGDLATAQARIAAAVGEFGDADGIAQRLDAAVAGLAELQADPASAAQQRDTRDRLADLVDGINEAYRTIAAEQTRAEAALQNDLAAIQDAVATIASADRGIGDPVGALRAEAGDVADLATDRLNATVPVVPGLAAGTASDTVAVRFGNEILRLNAGSELATGTTAGGDPAVVVDGRTVALSDIAGPGALGARATPLPETIPAALAALAAIAGDLIDAFTGPAVDPTLAAGEQGLFTDPLRAGGAAPPGGASRLSLNAALLAPGGEALLRDGINAAAPGAAADGSLPLAAIEALRGAGGASGPVDPASVAAGIADLSEALSRARLDAEDAQDIAETRRETLATLEGEIAGVDRDAEVIESTLVERYFGANAQVLNTAISMLDELIAIAR
ncbi:MAG: flagellar basal body protein [Pseudomonadota bacterium]